MPSQIVRYYNILLLINLLQPVTTWDKSKNVFGHISRPAAWANKAK